jgi:N-acyl-phosphatidylethanolamine-hydrolysing phospholipase D
MPLQAAHHDPRGGFRNPWPGSALPRFPSLIRWGIERRVRGIPPDPDPSVFTHVTPAFSTPRAAADVLTVTWIGHATALIQIGGRNVLTDPMFGERASPVSFAGPRRWVAPGVALAALPPLDLILLSHNHYDHLDVGSVRALTARFPGTPWMVPRGLAATVSKVGWRHGQDGRDRRDRQMIRELDWWEPVTLGGLTVAATPAQHFSARGPFDRNRTLWCGFAIAAEQHRVYFAGDTGDHPEFAHIAERLGPFDLALLPIGAYEPRWFMRPVHLNPEEAVQAFLDLGGGDRGVLMGIHWGTFKLTDEPMDEPPARTMAAWEKAGLPAERIWIPRHGETRTFSGNGKRETGNDAA